MTQLKKQLEQLINSITNDPSDQNYDLILGRSGRLTKLLVGLSKVDASERAHFCNLVQDARDTIMKIKAAADMDMA